MNIFKNKLICIFGLGYIGLPTASILGDLGFSVVGIDLDDEIIASINKSQPHIVEQDLEIVLGSAIKSGNFVAQKETEKCDVYIICVPTPLLIDGAAKKPDISSVIDAANKISKHLKAGDLVVLESTSPIGTTEKIKKILMQSGVAESDFALAYCPERVLPGRIIDELIANDRIVGGINDKSADMAANFYSSFVKGKIHKTSAKTAEMCKLAENSFRDVNLAFANEISMLCDNESIDVWELVNLANKHPRVNILKPGAGVGGHCIAVDPWFLISSDIHSSKLLASARQVNDHKVDWVIEKILANIDNSKPKSMVKIACLGLSFKADIDDVRESPALKIFNCLNKLGYFVMCVEPNIEGFSNSVQLDEAIETADVIAVLVPHKEFLLASVQERLRNADALDFCGALVG
jgi:UDP-N-acetyl-D-mannosaminuronic acid dehydrogenase